MNKSKRAPRRRSHGGAMGSGEDISATAGLLKHSLFASAAALILAMILILISAAITLSFDDPTHLALPLSVFIFCISFVACGYIAARSQGDAPLPAGLISGAILDILILAVAFIIGRDGMAIPSGIRALLFLAALPLSAIGAVLSNVRAPRRRRTTLRR